MQRCSFQESIPWLDNLGLTYKLGLDGISLPLVVLNSLLGLIAIYSSDESIRRPRFYYSLVLLILALWRDVCGPEFAVILHLL